MSQRGIRCVVFDQNVLPYGKIEDGLPKWHSKLRDQEEAKINEKLDNDLIEFVPKTALGRDLNFEEVLNWGFSAVMLATGAWKDRRLPVAGIDEFIGRGFHYQNPFIYWFNHFHEPDFSGEKIEISDGAIVIGGGLASIDVCKALMMLTVERALKERGIETNILELDKGINRKLDSLGLTLEDLNLKGCTLFYRRRIKDMRLSPIPPDTPEKLPKVQMIREKILDNACRKFLFNVEELHLPKDKIVENGELKGLIFQKTELIDGKVRIVEGSEKSVYSNLIISSIGSLPVPIPGIPMLGSTFEIDENKCCRIEGFKNVFALGNAVTGRGNIIESAKHGRAVAQTVAEYYLSDSGDLFEKNLSGRRELIKNQIENIAGEIEKLSPPTPSELEFIQNKISELQARAGYNGNFKNWVKRHLPVRLESMIKNKNP